MFLKNQITFVLFSVFVFVSDICQGQEEINAAAERFLQETSGENLSKVIKNNESVPPPENFENKPLICTTRSEMEKKEAEYGPVLDILFPERPHILPDENAFIKRVLSLGLLGVSIASWAYLYLGKIDSENLKCSLLFGGILGAMVSGAVTMTTYPKTLYSIHQWLEGPAFSNGHSYFNSNQNAELENLYYVSADKIEKTSMYFSQKMDISGTNVHFDGIYSTAEGRITAKKIDGKGILKANNIFINVKKFDFKGLIYCDGQCIITADEPIDENSFLRRGNGDFMFILNDKKE